MMQQEFKMNNEKKVYCKPSMEVVEMGRQADLLNSSDPVYMNLDDSEPED